MQLCCTLSKKRGGVHFHQPLVTVSKSPDVHGMLDRLCSHRCPHTEPRRLCLKRTVLPLMHRSFQPPLFVTGPWVHTWLDAWPPARAPVRSYLLTYIIVNTCAVFFAVYFDDERVSPVDQSDTYDVRKKKTNHREME